MRGKLTQGVLLLRDNAPAYTSQVVMQLTAALEFFTIPYILWTMTSLLLPKLKTKLRGRRFGINKGVKGGQ
jgi:hypothetical protein